MEVGWDVVVDEVAMVALIVGCLMSHVLILLVLTKEPCLNSKKEDSYLYKYSHVTCKHFYVHNMPVQCKVISIILMVIKS